MGGIPTDPDVVRFATMISIWGRWFMCLVVVFQLSYRPETWYPDDSEYLAFPVALVLCNGLVHLRIRGLRCRVPAVGGRRRPSQPLPWGPGPGSSPSRTTP